MKIFLTVILISFSSCLRIQVERNLSSAVPADTKTESYTSYEIDVSSKLSVSSLHFNEIIITIDDKRTQWKHFSPGKFRIWGKPAGYNINFETKWEECSGCTQKTEKPAGPVSGYLKLYPLAVLWTVGLQIPFSILDLLTLPIRILPKEEIHPGLKQKIRTEDIRKLKISFQNSENGDRTYIVLEKEKEVMIPIEKIFIPNTVFSLNFYDENGLFTQ
ncbi:MAG TPA: hypothetical protein PKA14_22670, partial [Leptospiraceae bacterium]|nr:hypothetical protein [Leptospiraceae bacterium]